MHKFDWFKEWESEEKTEERAVHGEPLLEGWSGLLIIILSISLVLLHSIWKPVVAIGAIWLGYESITAIVDYVQGVI